MGQTTRSLTLLCSQFALASCGTQGDLSLGSLPPFSDNTAADAAVGEATTPGADPATVTSGCTDSLVWPEPVRRFEFEGTGTELFDSLGGPSGFLRGGATLTGSGSVELSGKSDYVDLPNGLFGATPSASILLWTTLLDGPAYWRLLDLGRSSGGEDPKGSAVGTHYIAISTETGLSPSGLALLVGHGGASSEDRALTSIIKKEADAFLAIVLDGSKQQATLYLDGVKVADTSLSEPLSEIQDVNNWLGRSQYSADPYYPGTYKEFRFYDTALSACEVSALFELGPDKPR